MRNGLRCYFRKLHIHGMQHIPENGPVLLVANHPNAFLDALLIAAFTQRPLHFLARGDAFTNPILAHIFRSFNMLPVYRISEGKENLGKNTDTFDASHEVLKQQGIVLIFGEGWCVQNWDLRQLKKGTARIAERAWNDPQTQNMVVVPIGLTYEHFEGGGKSVVMQADTPITKKDNSQQKTGASFVKWLNQTITERLGKLVYLDPKLEPESDEHHHLMRKWKHAEQNRLNILESLKHPSSTLPVSPSSKLSFGFQKLLVTIPHYWMMQRISRYFTKETVFYDSILFALVVLLLPLYIGSITYLLTQIFYYAIESELP